MTLPDKQKMNSGNRTYMNSSNKKGTPMSTWNREFGRTTMAVLSLLLFAAIGIVYAVNPPENSAATVTLTADKTIVCLGEDVTLTGTATEGDWDNACSWSWSDVDINQEAGDCTSVTGTFSKDVAGEYQGNRILIF